MDDFEYIESGTDSDALRYGDMEDDSPGPCFRWTDSQFDVIKVSPATRLLVDAGPGTGKTAVACARVGHLVTDGEVNPSDVWFLSFTRTAVREIRDRIGSYIADAGDAASVRIATLDSHAWSMHSGFSRLPQQFVTYEKNIETVIELVRTDDDVRDYLGRLEHLVLDESQDIVGTRADLVMAIFECLPAECGITVFADPAQAIYGFAEEDDAAAHSKTSLLERIKATFDDEFKQVRLETIHRTETLGLIEIFGNMRKTLLGAPPDCYNSLVELSEQIAENSTGEPLPRDITDYGLAGADKTLLLYRTRSEVLRASGFLHSAGVEHRLRMSGLVNCIEPWIARILWDHCRPEISRDVFEDTWADRVEGTEFQTSSADEAWSELNRLAGKTLSLIDCRRLRHLLATENPPASVCYSEFGTRGPVLGTIHASKGREADHVQLILPKFQEDTADADWAEEGRVLFVGASRPRLSLRVGAAPLNWASSLNNGRAFIKLRRGKSAQVEFGRAGDIRPEGLVAKANPTAIDAQKALSGMVGRVIDVKASADPDSGYVYRVSVPDEELVLVTLDKSVNHDLFSIRNRLGGTRGLSKNIHYMRIVGVRTVAVLPDDPKLATLSEPWASSGMMLAPILMGYSPVHF